METTATTASPRCHLLPDNPTYSLTTATIDTTTTTTTTNTTVITTTTTTTIEMFLNPLALFSIS